MPTHEAQPALAPSGVALRLVLVACATVGVVLQATQRTDPTFFLRYFTIWCAVLSGAAAALGLVLGLVGRQPAALRWVRDASCVGALESGLVYLLVLLPAEGLPVRGPGVADDLRGLIGTALLHVVLPVLAVADVTAAHRTAAPARREAAAWALLPAAYVVISLGIARATGTAPAYAFLDPAHLGRAGVAAVAAAGVGIALVLAQGLVTWSRRHPAPPS